MEYLSPALWVLVPFAVQLVLLAQTRERGRPLRFLMLLPMGLLVPLALLAALALGVLLLAESAALGESLLYVLLSVLGLLAVLVFIPLILQCALLYLLGLGLAWAAYALWREKTRGSKNNSCKIPPGSL